MKIVYLSPCKLECTITTVSNKGQKLNPSKTYSRVILYAVRFRCSLYHNTSLVQGILITSTAAGQFKVPDGQPLKIMSCTGTNPLFRQWPAAFTTVPFQFLSE